MPFQAGYDKFTRFKPSFGSNFVIMCVTGHSWSEMIDAIDVTSTCHNGIQALLAGILRGEGNVKANVQSDVLPFNSLGIRAGVNGLLEFYYGYPIPFTAPCMIVKLNHKSAVESKVEYDFDVRLNTLAGAYTSP